jgi:putative (di)nucleoside polyphosphate hydrolase
LQNLTGLDNLIRSTMSEPADFHIYRPNVAAIVRDAVGRILLGERTDYPDSWQFPQGGRDPGESPEDALPRELREEISLEPGDYRIVARRGPYRYLFHGGRRKEGYRGQEQTYFLLDLLAPPDKISVLTPHPEFRSIRWVLPSQVRAAWVPPVKRDVYRQVLRDFFGMEIAS